MNESKQIKKAKQAVIFREKLKNIGICSLVGPTGPRGIPGTSISIKGNYKTLDELIKEHPKGRIGDAYLINGDLYLWNDDNMIWENVGNIKGPKGDKGDKGDMGAKGEKGDTGSKGDKGDTGLQGEIGPTGPKGEKGDTGEKGSPGITGQMGPQGVKGDTGATGPKGDVGPTGPKGEKGDAGPRGLQGEIGPKGDKGDVGPKGDRGEKGDTGPIGPKGEAGAKGEPGITGQTGPQGMKGDTGATGPKGDIGPTGPKGETGDIGPAGPKGEAGGIGAFAEKYLHSQRMLSVAQFVDTIIPLDNNNSAFNAEYTTENAINIKKVGAYRINYLINFKPSVDINYSIFIKTDGSILPGSDISKDAKANVETFIFGSVIGQLAINEAVRLYIKANKQVNLSFGSTTSAKLSIVKLD